MADESGWTLGDISRLMRQRDEHGIESLTDEEREALAQAEESAGKMFAAIPQETKDELVSSMATFERIHEAFEALPPEDQMRYGEWTLTHLEVFLPLIAERA